MTKREFNQDPEAVARARKKAGLTKYALAKRLGRARSTFTEIERDTRNAPETLLAEIAKVCGVPVETLRRKPASGQAGTAPEAGHGRLPELRDEERPDGAEDLPGLRGSAVGGF